MFQNREKQNVKIRKYIKNKYTSIKLFVYWCSLNIEKEKTLFKLRIDNQLVYSFICQLINYIKRYDKKDFFTDGIMHLCPYINGTR